MQEKLTSQSDFVTVSSNFTLKSFATCGIVSQFECWTDKGDANPGA